MKYLFEVPEEMKRRLAEMDSFVRFEITGPEESLAYREFLVELFAEFILWISPDNPKNEMAQREFREDHFRMWNGDTGGVALLEAKNYYIGFCKLMLFDGRLKGEYGSKLDKWKGLIFRDHHETMNDVIKVHLLSDALEKFLQEKKVKFERFNRETFKKV